MTIICDILGNNVATALLFWELSVQDLAAAVAETATTDFNYLELERTSLVCSLIRTCVDIHNNVMSLIKKIN